MAREKALPSQKGFGVAALLCAFLFSWALNNWLCGPGAAYADGVCLCLFALWLLSAPALMLLRRWKTEWASLWLTVGGFVLCLVFVLKLPYSFSYHDLAWYPQPFDLEALPDGHLGYVAYLAELGRLPVESPLFEPYTVFYNPPLSHLLQAGFVRLNRLLGIPMAQTLENMQVLTLLYAGACMLVVRKIMERLSFTGRGLRAGCLLFCFQPTLFLFGATVNNDLLAMLFALLCVLFTLRWQKERSLSSILLCALSLGAGMATKLNTAVLIPCIALVFAVCFFQDKEKKKYAKQFGLFLLLSVPLGTAWPLYQLIAHQVPLSYIRLPAETINVSGYSLAQRFGLPDWYGIRGLFCTGVRKIDHNFWMQTLKTGVFDELILYPEGTALWYISYAYLAMFAGLLLLSLGLFIRMLCKKNPNLPWLSKAFLAGYGVLLLGSYGKFALDYPYICTFHFRYIMPVLALCAIALAGYREKNAGLWPALAEGYAGAFAVLGMVVYGAYFF